MNFFHPGRVIVYFGLRDILTGFIDIETAIIFRLASLVFRANNVKGRICILNGTWHCVYPQMSLNEIAVENNYW